MNDILSKADIEWVVKEFYRQAIIDPVIGFFFTEVKNLSFEHHIPVIVSFWESILWDTRTYSGNPMLEHLELNRLSPMHPSHFERWMQLWSQTLRGSFSGPNVEKAIYQADTMAKLMMYKIGAVQ